MEPPWVVGIQRYAFFQDGQPPLPLAIQRQEPAEKPDETGGIGVEGQGGFSFRQKQLPLIAEEIHMGQGCPGDLVLRLQGRPFLGRDQGLFQGGSRGNNCRE